MKPTVFPFVIILFSIVLSNQKLLAQDSHDWELVWAEEFNYRGLPDPTKWTYEIGHIRNREKQYYTGPRLENVLVKKGKLYIKGQKEVYTNEFYIQGSDDWRNSSPVADYTSGCIITDGISAWKYGRIEVKAKLPRGHGIWPAIWMMGENRSEVGWPMCGEIDIMEFVGKEPEKVFGTVHFPGKEGARTSSNGGTSIRKTLSRKFHLYAIEWNEERIDFFLDNEKYHSFSLDLAGDGEDNPFRKPHYLLINLAMGADWPGPIDDEVLPQQFVIDYVRIYQKQE